MKLKLILAFILCATVLVNAQTGSSSQMWPCPFQDSGKITHYSFKQGCIPSSCLDGVKALSTQSLRAKDFTLSWIPVYTSTKITDFVAGSIAEFDNAQVTDTLSLELFGEAATAIVINMNNETFLYIYQNENDFQDMFIARLKQSATAQSVVDFMYNHFTAHNFEFTVPKKVEYETAALDIILHENSDLFLIDVYRF